METQKKLKTLMVRVTREEHRCIKEEALKRDTSITKLVLQSIIYYTEKFNK